MLSTKRLTPILFVVFLLLAALFFLNPPKTVLPSNIYSRPWPGRKAHEPPDHQHQHQHGEAPVTKRPAENNRPAAVNTAPPVPQPPPPSHPSSSSSAVAISYDKTTPPSVGCEAIVHDLQQRLIETYQKELKGIRYANVYGYLGLSFPFVCIFGGGLVRVGGVVFMWAWANLLAETENKGDAAIWSAQQILMSMMGIDFMEACRYVAQPALLHCYPHIMPSNSYLADSRTRNATCPSSRRPWTSTARIRPS